MKDQLNDAALLEMIDNIKNLKRGDLVRRVSDDKDQQGCFMNFDDEGDLIVVNVVDCTSCSFLSSAGIVRLRDEDTLYRYKSVFGNNPETEKAAEVIRSWSLFKKNPEIQDSMMYFIRMSYSPAQIIDLKEKDKLQHLFVPVQQKFQIGRFRENVNWNQERKKRFQEHLESLNPGDHITYVALVPQLKTHSYMFYSIGTKPHQETEKSLRSEPFNFIPTHGGHIKAVKTKGSHKEFLVDAGSNHLGRGTGTLLETAKNITIGLRRHYKEYIFTPVEGRKAFGTEQSY